MVYTVCVCARLPWKSLVTVYIQLNTAIDWPGNMTDYTKQDGEDHWLQQRLFPFLSLTKELS